MSLMYCATGVWLSENMETGWVSPRVEGSANVLDIFSGLSSAKVSPLVIQHTMGPAAVFYISLFLFSDIYSFVE